MHYNSFSTRRWMRAVVAGLIVASSVASGTASAQSWPARPIRLVVSFPPGNSADMIAREMAPLLAQRLGQPVVIENRAGAGGSIGVDAVAKAAPDGYTFGMTSLSPISIIPALKRKLPYDAVKDIAPVTLTGYGPMVLLVKKDSPINSVAELIALARSRPGELTYGSLGTGTISHMTTEAFKAAAGVPLTEVPYKGSAQALTDLVGGSISVMFDGATSAVAQVNAGNLKALGVTTLKRSALLPDVPTMDEIGLPALRGFEATGWIGLIAPGATPRAIVERLQVEATRVMQDPSVAQRIRSAGQTVPDPNTPEQFADYIARDLARWTRLANDLKIVGQE